MAENGTGYCQGPQKLVECTEELSGLPPADGIILVDTNPGNAASAVRRINAAVTNDHAILNDNQPAEIDPSLDPFRPENGYNAGGASTYTEAFRERYFTAQSERMNGLIELAQSQLRDIENGVGRFTDNDVLIVVRADTAELMVLDTSIHHTSMRPQKVLRNDGTVVRQIVESVRVPLPELATQNTSLAQGALFLTVRSLPEHLRHAVHAFHGRSRLVFHQ